MGVEKFLWDTNIVVYYLQQQFPSAAEQFMDNVVSGGQLIISAITEIELMCWKTSTEKDEEILRSFINDSIVIELEQAIKLQASLIKKAHRIKLADAIIGATAIVYDLTLLSRNSNDFKKIPGLRVVNPWEK